MSFWKSLFGGAKSDGGDTAPSTARSVEHNGYTIEAQPYPEGGQFQVAGTISKEIGGVRKEHKFIRADRFSTKDEAAEFSLTKGRQIVDQQGDRLFG